MATTKKWIFELIYSTTWNDGNATKSKYFTSPEQAQAYHINYSEGVKKATGLDHRILDFKIVAHALDFVPPTPETKEGD